ncbi:peripheral myelin protein 22-like [Dreissena polymorpha]|uniref:Uncharacterized protein n=1 Tax=Dreissena polymorpha TaxID=45954 RepID=A0A9D4BRB8_DREPO|nr:peripheral myelin protein 22-like [Dreissena polymorpha]KAH3704823.1 hypothetical protein DPMN_079884 [Dreissena polymorpha]
MPDKKQILSFAVIGIAGLTVLFCILALALPDWFDGNGSKSGLWKTCFLSICFSFKDITVPDWMEAIRAFAFLGLFAMVGATVTFVLNTFIMKDKPILLYLTIGFSAATGCFMIIAFAIYADKSGISEYGASKYGAGFALCIIAWPLAWTVSGLCVVIMLMNRSVAKI